MSKLSKTKTYKISSTGRRNMTLKSSPKAALSGQSKPADGKRHIIIFLGGFTILGAFCYEKQTNKKTIFVL